MICNVMFWSLIFTKRVWRKTECPRHSLTWVTSRSPSWFSTKCRHNYNVMASEYKKKIGLSIYIKGRALVWHSWGSISRTKKKKTDEHNQNQNQTIQPPKVTLGLVLHTCISSTWGGSRSIKNSRSSLATYRVLGHPGLHEILSKQQQQNIDRPTTIMLSLQSWVYCNISLKDKCLCTGFEGKVRQKVRVKRTGHFLSSVCESSKRGN